MDLLRPLFSKLATVKSYGRVLSKCVPVEGGNGRCVCELTIEEEHENLGGTLHGGLTATLVDAVSTAALLTHERAHPGVSVDLNVSYLRPVKRGETIIIDAIVLRAGQRLAYTQVEIKNKKDMSLVATGRHTKAFPG